MAILIIILILVIFLIKLGERLEKKDEMEDIIKIKKYFGD